jgi:DNA-binding NtrC family response regulator
MAATSDEGRADRGRSTAALPALELGGRTVRRFRLVVAEGPKRGLAWESTGDRCAIGSHLYNDLVLDDQTISRFHCEVRLDAAGAHIRDLESLNGTVVDGLRVNDAWLKNGSLLRIGRTALQFQLAEQTVPLSLSERTEFGSLVGSSAAMRAAFALLEAAAATSSNVLIEGETGTGKEGAAEGLHLGGARRDKPLVVVDCGSIPSALLESELFGHEKGSFTGALGTRIGAFEEASGGTIFLDEIGELPLDVQPKLLRALERREIRRVGSNLYRPVDVRVISATHRDLRQAVNAGTFRPDLYFRLAVLRVTLPPLRGRTGDLPLLVERILHRLGAPPERTAPLLLPEFLERVAQNSWPGNVRELRNYLERCLAFDQPPAMEETAAGEDAAPPTDPDGGPYSEARQRALEGFERRYLKALLRKHGGKVADAAAEAGIERVSFYRLMRRHGMNRETSRG